MPKIQVPGDRDSQTSAPWADLSPDLKSLNQTLRDNLNVRTTADVYQKLAGTSDSSLPVMQGLGEALAGMSKGWQGIADMQNLTQKQFLEMMQGQHGAGGVEEMMKWMFLYRMMKEMGQEETGKTSRDDDAPTWRDLLAEQEKRHAAVREAEQQARQDPMNEQLQGTFYGMMAQLLQNQLQPQNPLDFVRQAHETVNTVQQWTGGDHERSFQERRLEKLDDLAMQRMTLEFQDKQQAREDRQKARREDYPALANQVVNGLGQLMQGFGFRPMGGGPDIVSPEAMAAAQQAPGAPA